MNQLDLFINSERHRENNPASQRLHDDNLIHFAGQNQKVYDLLKKGVKLTTGEALLRLKIGDLRARIRTLRKAGIPVEDEFVKGSRYKKYFIKQP